MSNALEALGVLLLALNAPAALYLWRRTTSTAPRRDAALMAGLAALGAGAVVLACAALGDPILDLLDVSVPTFQVATGFLLILGSIPSFMPSTEEWYRSNGRLVWPAIRLGLALGSPAVLAAAILYSADNGAGSTLLAAAVAVVLSGLVVAGGRRIRAVPETLLIWAGRFLSAALVVIAVGFIREGVERV